MSDRSLPGQVNATRNIDLKDKKRQNERGDASDICVVRVLSNPGPDAEDRLRRLLSLMVRYSTGNGQDESGSSHDADDRPVDDSTREEA